MKRCRAICNYCEINGECEYQDDNDAESCIDVKNYLQDIGQLEDLQNNEGIDDEE